MPRISGPKRTQFSSCDACRLSRVACDASQARHSPGKSCTRCNRKKQDCTFEWIKNAKIKVTTRAQSALGSHSSHPPLQDSRRESLQTAGCTDTQASLRYICIDENRMGNSSSIDPATNLDNQEIASTTYNQYLASHSLYSNRLISRQSESPSSPPSVNLIRTHESVLPSTRSGTHTEDVGQAEAESVVSGFTDNVFALRAQHIFRHGFESTFGALLGRYSCPYVDDPNSEIHVPLQDLMRKLDAEHDQVRRSVFVNVSEEVAPVTNDVIDEYLDRAILAFTARWFPLRLQLVERREIATKSWRSSRRDMLVLLNRVSYRSVLALYLFAQTPVPVGILKEEELDGVSGPVCMHTAMMHIQKLRQRCDPVRKGIANITQMFLNLESRAYWAAVMWDTTDAMSSEMRTLLTSGLNGACGEPAWRLSKAFLVGSFGPATDQWHANGFDVNNENASKIIGAASVSQTLFWKNITSLKEALREGVHEDTVTWVWATLLEAMGMFGNSTKPLLNACEKRIHFLNQSNRFGWFEVTLRYCIGVMALVDALEIAKRTDLLEQLLDARTEVEHESFAVLKFGTDNTYGIPAQDLISGSEETSISTMEPMILSFIALYASPDHIITLARSLLRAVVHRCREEKLDSSVFNHLFSVVFGAVDQLPETSKAVHSARHDLQALSEEILA